MSTVEDLTDWDRLLASAITGRGVHVHLQPIVDIQHLEVVGYEALARFDGPFGGRPDLWFAAARQAGLAAELDAAVLGQALDLRDALPGNRLLALNVEPDSLGSDIVDRALTSRPLAGIVLELTEHVPVDSYAELTTCLDRYRSNGALIAIDDAGAGYAGLQHILQIRPAFLKLDRALIKGVDDDAAKAALVEMLGTFADRVDAWVIAEGVETQAEARTLVDLGVPLVQGYLFARPGPDRREADPDALDSLRSYRRDCAREPLRPLVREAPYVQDRAGLAVEDLLSTEQGAVTVVLDRAGRPLGTVSAGEDVEAVAGHLDPTMRVSLSTSPAELAHRMATRPPDQQLLPVVCCDDEGHYVGIVTAPRLMRYLAQALPAPAGPSWRSWCRQRMGALVSRCRGARTSGQAHHPPGHHPGGGGPSRSEV